jgi:S-adenosylmethionine hydrolase
MKRSGLITLTTDFGIRDAYVAMMKGVIFTIYPQARLVDVTHQVTPGAIAEAADLIMENFPYFPQGTVHLGVIDPGVGGERRPIALCKAGHFFVGPDNGLFGPIIEDYQSEIKVIHLTNKQYFLPRISHTFHGREIFAPVAAHIARGVEMEEMGEEIRDPEILRHRKPRLKGEALYGQIVRIDRFGNLITDIRRDALIPFTRSGMLRVQVGRVKIHGLSRTYSDKKKGDLLSLINSSDRLEIAVNGGRASERIEVNPDEVIGSMVCVRKAKRHSR